MNRTRAALALGLLLVSAPAPAQQGQKNAATPRAETVWHAQQMATSEIGGFSISYFWSRGRNLRVATVLQGQPMLTLVHGDTYYAIDELRGTGLAIQRGPAALAADAKGERPFAEEARMVLGRGGEKIRTEKLAGRDIDVYRLNDEAARRDVWVTQGKEPLPLRVEVFDKGLKSPSRRDYIGWTQALELPDAFFEPDPRVKLERYTYDEYVKKAADGPLGPVPILFGTLLHGEPTDGAPAPAPTSAPTPR
jgi:hypothetical protein